MDKKICRIENCNKEAGDHMLYDTTLCKDHAYDDEIQNGDRNNKETLYDKTKN